MEFLQLRYFVRLAELNSVRKTAAEMGVAPSAVCNNIKVLENELGTSLFNRNGNLISVNATGRKLYGYVNTILQLADDSKKELADHNGRLDYDLSVCSLTIPRAIPFIVKSFRHRYPEIVLKSSSYQKLSNSSVSNNDITIFSSNSIITSKNTKTVYREPILLAVSREHPFAQMDEIDAALLQNEQFIRPSELSDHEEMITGILTHLQITPSTAVFSDQSSFIEEMVAANMAVAFLPYLQWKFSPIQNIELVPIRDHPFYRYTNIRWPEGRYLSGAAIAFIDLVVEFFSKMEDDFTHGYSAVRVLSDNR